MGATDDKIKLGSVTDRLLSKKLIAYLISVGTGVGLAIANIITGDQCLQVLQTSTIAYLATEGGLDAVRSVQGNER